MRSHFKGVKSTGLDTVTQPQTSHRTYPLTAGKGGQCLATVNPHVIKFVVGTVAARAGVVRNQGLSGSGIDSHDGGYV